MSAIAIAMLGNFSSRSTSPARRTALSWYLPPVGPVSTCTTPFGRSTSSPSNAPPAASRSYSTRRSGRGCFRRERVQIRHRQRAIPRQDLGQRAVGCRACERRPHGRVRALERLDHGAHPAHRGGGNPRVGTGDRRHARGRGGRVDAPGTGQDLRGGGEDRSDADAGVATRGRASGGSPSVADAAARVPDRRRDPGWRQRPAVDRISQMSSARR